MKTLQELYGKFAVHPEGRWIMQFENARRLYNLVKSGKMKNVLDLGTGAGLSAAIIALGMEKRGELRYKITSVEQFEKCIKLADELIPEELKKNTTIHLSSVVTYKTNLIPFQYFSNYENTPEGDYDMILNDGPSAFLYEDKLVELPNGTLIELLLKDKIKPGCIVIFDGRIEALKILERYFSDNFYLLETGGRFTVLERKDNPVIFKDQKLEWYKKTTYFNDKTVVSN